MQHNPFSLAGRTVLVTGASSGIGRATAIECSRAGATVIITGRNEERLAETLAAMEPGEHTAIAADLSTSEAVAEFVGQLPKIDGLVLCAGIGCAAPVTFCTRERFNKVFDINFFSTVELLRLAYKQKKLVKGGSAVAMASVGGNENFTVGKAIYGSSKAALHSFVKSAAKEFAARGIRVNDIMPGMVETPLIRGGALSEKNLDDDVKRYPLGRYGRPEEVAWAAVYLLSEATAWMTGQSIVIDGGVTL